MKAARRPERREEIEGFFRVPTEPHVKMLQSQRGGGKIRQGAAKPHSIISLIPLRLSLTHRPHPRRSRKIGEDDSDPPKNRGVMWPR